MDHAIVITGVGAVTSNGCTYEEFANSCMAKKSGIKESERIDLSALKGRYVGEIDYDLLKKRVDFSDSYDKTTYLAYCAALEALQQSGLTQEYIKGKNIAIIIGTLFGGYNSLFHLQKTYMEKESFHDMPLEVFEYFFPCAIPDFLSKKFHVNGPRIVVSNACSSGGSAVGMAYDLIKSGVVDMAIAGGTDELNKLCIGGFNSLGAISSKKCKPYVDSKGINIGEGAGIFVLEKEECCQERKANIKANIQGYYLNADAYHITKPNPKGEGAYHLMKTVTDECHVKLEDIAFINGHGTGTNANDTAEIRAINKFFENTDLKVKLTSNKANIGHCMGAAGAVELAATIASLEKKQMMPLCTDGSKETEHVHVVTDNEPVNKPIAVSNSFAFGGNNVSVVVSDPDYTYNSVEYESDPVVITGVDCIGNHHASFEEFKEMLMKAPVDFVEAEKGKEKGPTHYKGNIPDINFRKFMAPDTFRRTDMITKLAVVTSARAISDANIVISNQNTNRVGHVFASSIGPINTIRDLNNEIIHKGIEKLNPIFFPNSVYNAAPGYITMNSRIKGATITINAESSSLICSMMYAKILINSKKADKVVVTIADDYNDIYQFGYNHFGVLSEKSNINEFSNQENTVILSKGSVSFVLESKKSALDQGKKMYAEMVAGSISGSGNDNGILSPNLNNYWDTIARTLNKAGMDWNDVDLYCSPCSGFRKNDIIEKENIWENMTDNVSISSVKPYVGFNVGIQSAYSLASALTAFEKNCSYVIKNNRLEKEEKVYKSALLGAYAVGNTTSSLMIRKP